MLRKLEKEFKRGTRTFKQVYNDDSWYIYEVSINYKDGYVDKCFEVFKKKVEPLRVYIKDMGWTKVEGDEMEMYPSNEDFGINNAWCTSTFERAMRYVSGELPKR